MYTVYSQLHILNVHAMCMEVNKHTWQILTACRRLCCVQNPSTRT